MRALFTLLALLTLLATAAAAPPAKEQARQLTRQGNGAYNVGRFEEARALYERAYALYPAPKLIFNMAQCERQLGRYERAAFLYNSYLRQAAGADNRAEVEERIREMERLLAEERARVAAAKAQKQASVLPRPTPGLDDLPTPPRATEAPSRPWYKRWYVWAGVGAVIVGGTVGAVLATRSSGPEIPPTASGNMAFFGAR